MLNLTRILSAFAVATVFSACSTSDDIAEEAAVEVAEETLLAAEMTPSEEAAPEGVEPAEEAPVEEVSEAPAESEEPAPEEEVPAEEASEEAAETPEAG